MPLLHLPEPFDFELSTERFRAFGPDLANLWVDGALHRVVGAREVRIEPVLEREGVLGAVELRANRVDALPDGWQVHYRVAEICEVCGEPCKRGDLPDGEVIYAGDGHSDYCAALAADRVYATGSLAGYLDRRGVPYEPLTDFRALA